jgi:hypothetical protein
LNVSWKCADGETYSSIFSGTAIRPLNVTTVTNKFGQGHGLDAERVQWPRHDQQHVPGSGLHLPRRQP